MNESVGNNSASHHQRSVWILTKVSILSWGYWYSFRDLKCSNDTESLSALVRHGTGSLTVCWSPWLSSMDCVSSGDGILIVQCLSPISGSLLLYKHAGANDGFNNWSVGKSGQNEWQIYFSETEFKIYNRTYKKLVLLWSRLWSFKVHL